MKYASYPPDKQVGDYQWNHQAHLGSGAFGKVYLGKKIGSEELLAIKVMENGKLSDPYLKKALDNEISIMKTLKGPNVVRLLDFLQTKNNTYILQEFCDGGDFRSILTKRGKIPEEEARKIYHDILSGMKVMVENNFIHRDLKPENILLSKGNYKVSDYGFSRHVDNFQSKMLKTMVGTPLYMSPQILLNQEYTTKSDVWSIGLIYYEILFGKTPWDARSQYELINNIKKIPLQFPCSANISEDSRNFLKGCLVLEEKGRFTWEQVFSHPLYTKHGDKLQIQPSLPKFDDTARRLLTELQEVIKKFDVNVEKLFKKFDTGKEGTLNMAEFTNLLVVIDKTVNKNDAEKVFMQFDVNKDGTINMDEFKKLVLETDYKEDNTEQNMLLDYRANKLLKKLTDIIIDNRIDLKKVFNKFDSSGDRILSEEELGKLLKIIDENIEKNDAHFIFKKFDNNGDGSVSIDEFMKFFKIEKESIKPDLVKKESKDYYPNGSTTQIQKMMRELKDIITLNQIDLKLVFKNFDTSGDNMLNPAEFIKLIKVINGRYLDSEINELFKTFDSNGDKNISYLEFSKYLL